MTETIDADVTLLAEINEGGDDLLASEAESNDRTVVLDILRYSLIGSRQVATTALDLMFLLCKSIVK